MADKLADAPIGGQIVQNIPYYGKSLLTKVEFDGWEDEEGRFFTSEEIEADINTSWVKYGDDWHGNAVNWEAKATKYKDAIDQSIAVLFENPSDAKMVILKILQDACK